MSGLEGALCRGRPKLFLSTHPLDHEAAAAICQRCTALEACGELRDEVIANTSPGPAYSIEGTWAGVLYSPKKPVGRPRKEHIK